MQGHWAGPNPAAYSGASALAVGTPAAAHMLCGDTSHDEVVCCFCICSEQPHRNMRPRRTAAATLLRVPSSVWYTCTGASWCLECSMRWRKTCIINFDDVIALIVDNTSELHSAHIRCTKTALSGVRPMLMGPNSCPQRPCSALASPPHSSQVEASAVFILLVAMACSYGTTWPSDV